MRAPGATALAELDELVRIARAASAVVREVYATPFTVELKGPGDPVTRADREANELICRALAASFPGESVIAEESAPASQAELSALVAAPRVLFVDPLDGTREFAERNGEFAVMIGLAARGRAELGVVVMPTTGEALAGWVGPGERGSGGGVAFVEDAAGRRRPLAVSPLADPAEATLVVSRSHRPPLIAPFAAALGVRRVVPCGSVGVKVARIVTGAAHLYVHAGSGAKHWDTCGPEALLVAAGGELTDLAGRRLDYARADLSLRAGLAASNGALHAAALAAAARALSELSPPPAS